MVKLNCQQTHLRLGGKERKMTNQEKLQDTAKKLIESYTTQVQKIENMPKDDPLRMNLLGYKHKAVNFIIEMAEIYHKEE